MPYKVRRLLKPLRDLYHYNRFKVDHRSDFDNTYHCCTQKTASQWFSGIFRDPKVYRYCGLRPLPYDQVGLKEAPFDSPLPARTIDIHLYIDYPTYLTIPKPARYKTFFVLRDPRDIVVSFYFSTKYSHPEKFYIAKLRKELNAMNIAQGMQHCIDVLNDMGPFAAQRSWLQPSENECEFKILRYEDFAQDNHAFLKSLFDYLEIPVAGEEFDALYERHKFTKKTGGRSQGVEALNSHYRKGVAGDWHEHFDKSVNAHFMSTTQDPLEVLGYQKYWGIEGEGPADAQSRASMEAHHDERPQSDHLR